jgi:hypothetical protein
MNIKETKLQNVEQLTNKSAEQGSFMGGCKSDQPSAQTGKHDP